ncbi:hypothetical protein GCM10027590_04230 [Nocardiopsis nanhaiensis]
MTSRRETSPTAGGRRRTDATRPTDPAPSSWRDRRDTVLSGRYLVTEYGEGDHGRQLQVETHLFGAERAERVIPVEDPLDRELVFSEEQGPHAVPGAVVFQVENVVGSRYHSVLYGLVP